MQFKKKATTAFQSGRIIRGVIIGIFLVCLVLFVVFMTVFTQDLISDDEGNFCSQSQCDALASSINCTAVQQCMLDVKFKKVLKSHFVIQGENNKMIEEDLVRFSFDGVYEFLWLMEIEFNPANSTNIFAVLVNDKIVASKTAVQNGTFVIFDILEIRKSDRVAFVGTVSNGKLTVVSTFFSLEKFAN